MRRNLSSLIYLLTPPLIWNAYLRARARVQTFPWRQFGTMMTVVDCSPLVEGRFGDVCDRFASLDRVIPTESTRYRHFNICYFANMCRNVPGDFLCAGVSWGSSARKVYEFTDFGSLGKTLHLVDPFEGIVSKRTGDLNQEYNQDPNYVLAQYPKDAPIKLHRKRIPLADIPAPLAFVFTDTGDAVSDAEALAGFYEALSPGGVLVTEQYHDDIPRYQKVLDRLGASALWLPSGQGVIFKR